MDALPYLLILVEYSPVFVSRQHSFHELDPKQAILRYCQQNNYAFRDKVIALSQHIRLSHMEPLIEDRLANIRSTIPHHIQDSLLYYYLLQKRCQPTLPSNLTFVQRDLRYALTSTPDQLPTLATALFLGK